ncbi:SMC-Scp complex subunit ScpB [Candidatus Parcubacteria bacterium]|nr:SMC-Scp complex subunit ScpB [Candidatus Parcubacteria bacterium]
MENLVNKIESLLFYQVEPMKIKKMAEILEVDEENINQSIQELEKNLENRGVKLIKNDDVISLTTSPENSDIIEKIKKEEQDKELSKAALETLSIILYRGPIKRSVIDYIRGVNSQFSLRSLLIKGLIEKEQSKDDERAFVYKPSIDLLSYMGISKIEELPEYKEVNEDINIFIESERENDK